MDQTIPFADGYEDYFTLLNERDGGLGVNQFELLNVKPPIIQKKGWNVMNLQKVKVL